MTDTLSNSAKNEAIEALLAAALMNADAFGGDVLAAARAMLEDAAAAKAEREMDPFDRGYRDSREQRGYDRDYVCGLDEGGEFQYSEGYNEGEVYLADTMGDQIESDYLDGECTLSGVYR